MTNFLFDEMSQEQASYFAVGDQLIFALASATNLSLSVRAASGLSVSSTTITAAGKTLTFHTDALQSAIDDGIIFIDGSQLDITLTPGLQFPPPPSPPPPPPVEPTSPPPPATDGVIAGTSGHDNLFGTAGNDVMSGGAGHDNLFGGAGEDQISGDDGNDHIYGFDITGDPTTDSADTLKGGAGSDFIQGNAGDDLLYGENGSDRLTGGRGDDTILGGVGNDSVNGNKGQDYISAGADNDLVRGGQDDDEINGDEGYDIIYGDLGNDVIFGGAGLDMLYGGEGADVFGFFAGHAAFVRDGGYLGSDYIRDFQIGIDKIMIGSSIGTAPGDLLYAAAGTVTDMTGALRIANELLAEHAGNGDVAIIAVGPDSYLFYNDAGGASANAVIRIAGIAPDAISSSDFLI